MTDFREHTARFERLREVAAYDLADPALRAELDELARRTALATGHDVSMVNILLSDAQATVGSHGLTGPVAEIGGLPAEWSFCLHMVMSGEPMVITDAGSDPRSEANPLVRLGLVGSYAGVPLVAENGVVLGGHCVVSAAPGACTDADLAALHEGARAALAALVQRRSIGTVATAG